MKPTKLFIVMLSALVMCTIAVVSFAQEAKMCPIMGGGYGMQQGQQWSQKGSCPMCKKKGQKDESLEKKFNKKVNFFMQHQELLDLSEDQVQQIEDLKLMVKKDLIMKKAEIEVVTLDIKVALKEWMIDAPAVNGLLDVKYELKKQKAKNLVAAYAKLKAVLTDDQKAAVKEMWKGKDSWKKKGSGMMKHKGMMGMKMKSKEMPKMEMEDEEVVVDDEMSDEGMTEAEGMIKE